MRIRCNTGKGARRRSFCYFLAIRERAGALNGRAAYALCWCVTSPSFISILCVCVCVCVCVCEVLSILSRFLHSDE